MSKPAEQVQIDFIIDCLRKGEKRQDILAKFCNIWQRVKIRTFDSRLKAASTALKAQQKRIEQSDDSIAAAMIKDRHEALMGSCERKEILAQIARGQIDVTLKKPCWDTAQRKFVMVPVSESPDHQARIRAIAELNRMEGSYAPDRLDLTEKQITGMVIEK
jgi:hypothetical protein